MGEGDISRREAILRAAVIAAGAGLAACDAAVRQGVDRAPGVGGATDKEGTLSKEKETTGQDGGSRRMPVVFLPHGGGPWPFVEMSGVEPGMWDGLSAYLKRLKMTPPVTPRALLIVSAHWEAPTPTVMASPRPPMLYDYSGFPPEAYRVQWPAPGLPELAGDIQALLERAGFATSSDATRGFDHGAFVPMKLTWPEADVPALQLSLKQGLDPAEHLRIGRALAPLRDQGVFIVGSGMSYHNLRALMMRMRGGPSLIEPSRAFDDWLAESMALEPDRRESRLVEWAKAPQARACHPREEHLLPLHVIAGAGGDDAASLPYRDVVMGAHVCAIHFG